MKDNISKISSQVVNEVLNARASTRAEVSVVQNKMVKMEAKNLELEEKMGKVLQMLETLVNQSAANAGAGKL